MHAGIAVRARGLLAPHGSTYARLHVPRAWGSCLAYRTPGKAARAHPALGWVGSFFFSSVQ